MVFTFFGDKPACSRSHQLVVDAELESLSPSLSLLVTLMKTMWLLGLGYSCYLPSLLWCQSIWEYMEMIAIPHFPLWTTMIPMWKLHLKGLASFGFKSVWSHHLLGYKSMDFWVSVVLMALYISLHSLICIEYIFYECSSEGDCQSVQILDNFSPLKWRTGICLIIKVSKVLSQ